MDVHKDDKRRRKSGFRKTVTMRPMRKVVAISVISPRNYRSSDSLSSSVLCLSLGHSTQKASLPALRPIYER